MTTTRGVARARWEPVIRTALADGEWHRPTDIARVAGYETSGARYDSIRMILLQLQAEGDVEADRVDGNPARWRLRQVKHASV